VNAVKTWPGLNWAILQEPGQYVMMEPGQIHAVVSPVNSAVTGWSFVLSDWLRSRKLSEMMNWEMNVIEDRLKEPEIGADSPFISGGPAEGISHDLDLWTMWLESGVLDAELRSMLKTLRDEMKNRLEQITKRRKTGKPKRKNTRREN